MGPLEHGDPERIGRYRLIGRLGAGGMGQVYFGRSAGGRAVAVKRIHPHLATDASFRERFAREVTAARQVSGAFTAPVIDADPDGEVPWLVTSYVPSLPLDDAVRDHGGLPEPTLRVLAAGLAEALTEIHRVGLIHRDLKPGNVLLAEDGPRVIDFGIARATDGTAATQSIIGTPGFMSPEQIQGESLTPVSDMFAFGAVLVFAAGGVGPFGQGAMPTMVMRIIQHEPDLSAVPPSLQRIVAACLAKDARRRPGPGDVLDALGDVPISDSWLPPHVMDGVRAQVGKVNAALSGAPTTTGAAGAGGATSVLGAAAAGAAGGAAAAHLLGNDQATRAATQAGADPTAAMGAQGDRTAQYPHQPTGGYGDHPKTAVYGQDPGAGAPPTAAMPPAGGQGGDDYADLYGGSRRGADQTRRAAEEQRRQEADELRRRREEQRRREERDEQRRRQEAERAHRERMRAEEQATRRAQAQSRQADQPGLWSFVKLIPLLIIPIIQIPLGWGASYAWQWFTTESGVWTGQPFYYETILSADGFFQALFLGYFLLNNVVALEYLIRSLRTGFVTGVLLAAAVVAATNGALYYNGFFG
ncbi:serine/threonine-protein kinase [Nocardiopsis mangrovi]|uniref:non-specific serine/threonine protein kinase n=1 Tax=Nocardiopsis mangrovi TaxID=1179818 RepID=A0ABV9DVG8_9ACTN